VKPIQICTHLGQEHVNSFYGELAGGEIRKVLKAGGTNASVPSTAFTREQRLKAWRRRFDAEFERGNDQLALALLLEWLMRHHRQMLVDYLDFLGVEHRQGETDEDFCETNSPEKLREGIDVLMAKYPPHHVAVYLLLVGHLQETAVFDETPKLLEALGMDAKQAAAYVEHHQKTFKKSDRKSDQGAA
jgi:hypothetical protein